LVINLVEISIPKKFLSVSRTQNPSHLLYKQRINYEKFLLIKRKFEKKVLKALIATPWDRYEEKTLRTSEFLREVGNLFAPSVSRTTASSD
jgi:hypothetical protein